ncbi:hypothetical protein A6A03_08185 [Chloroflexus islandicus]|uniref:Peptidase S1 domain-containing protein n=1 Tax=Chloroflexus islandicus TaxID=1707952 RepID=A0A178MI12_9CHLR|nr:trypsin-like serine protease [Chloroflexus islandicus]OAN48351.1 hypothetical protein A6A03_08185 [Chloroflexus islandicus]
MRQRIVLLALIFLIGLLPASVASREGAPPQLTIVGGNPVAPGDYPWLVALLIAEITDEAAAFCGGALIDDGGVVTETSWVLTAAHCLADGAGNVADPAAIQVLVGQQDLSQATAAQRRDVAEILVHPLYVPDAVLYNDVALIRLATPVTGITPIRIATPADAARFAPGETAYIAGWGNRLPQTGFDFPDVAHKAQAPIVDLTTCNERYDGALSSVHLCAGVLPDGGVDTCQGDSGGPLMVSDGSGGFLHAGIVSFGTGCGWPHFPGVYALTAFFADWIEAQITGSAHIDIWQLPLPAAVGLPLHLSTAAPGTPFEYAVLVANSGALPLTDVVVTVELPVGATLVSGSISDGGVYDSNTNTVEWSFTGLLPGEVLQLSYQVQAAASVTSGDYQVVADSDDGLVISFGRESAVTVINQPRLYVAAFYPTEVEAGSIYPVQFTVGNFGLGPNAGLTDLELVVDLPAGVNPVAIEDGGVQTGNQVRWTMSELPAGDEVFATLQLAAGKLGDVLRITNYGVYNGVTPLRYGVVGVQIVTGPAVRYLPMVFR